MLTSENWLQEMKKMIVALSGGLEWRQQRLLAFRDGQIWGWAPRGRPQDLESNGHTNMYHINVCQEGCENIFFLSKACENRISHLILGRTGIPSEEFWSLLWGLFVIKHKYGSYLRPACLSLPHGDNYIFSNYILSAKLWVGLVLVQ